MVLADTGHDVAIWDRDPRAVEYVNVRHKAAKLQDLDLPRAVAATWDVGQALDGCSLVVSATSSPGLTEVTRAFAPLVPPGALLVSGTKGLEPDTLVRPSEAWLRCNPSLAGRVVAISGPNFAIEIARKLPAATVVASKSTEAAEGAQSAFITPYLRVYTHWDIAGVELGGSRNKTRNEK
jgi:glycerol-3-phosphate dehydrogenase (NAD(P)+)